MQVEKVSRGAGSVFCTRQSGGLRGFLAGMFTAITRSNFESRPLTEAALWGMRWFWIYELQEGTASQTEGADRKLWEVHFLLDIKKKKKTCLLQRIRAELRVGLLLLNF